MVCVPALGVSLVGSDAPAARSLAPLPTLVLARAALRTSAPSRPVVQALSFSTTPPVAALSAVPGSVARRCLAQSRDTSLPWSRPSSGASPRRWSGLVPFGSAKHLPACHDAGFTALHPLPGSGKVACLSRRFPAGFLVRLWHLRLLRRSRCFPLAVSRSRLPAPARWVRCDTVPSGDGELPSDVPRKGNGAGRGCTVIGASRSSLASGAGFPPSRWPDQLSSGLEGILLSLVLVPFRKVRAPGSTLSLRSRPLVRRCLGSSFRFFRHGNRFGDFITGVLGGFSRRIACGAD